MDPKQAFQNTAGNNNGNNDEDDELRRAAAELKRASEKFAALADARKNTGSGSPAIADIMNDVAAAQDNAARAETALLPRQMDHNLKTVRGWIAGLSDTGHPALGQEFETRFARAGFKLETDPELECTAIYSSFSLKKDNAGFVDTISFGKYAAQNPYKLFNAYLHENIHGYQKHASAALLASPFNAQPVTVNINYGYGGTYAEDVSIVICPEDWLILQEKCEQDAYAKQGWLNSLLAQTEPAAIDAGAKDALSARAFLDCRARAGGDLAGGLRLAAAQASSTKFFIDAKGNPTGKYTFAHNWQDIALRAYRDAIDVRRDRGPTNFVFVRVSPEDVHAIGNSFGPNPFGPDPYDPALLERTPCLSTLENKSFGEPGAQRLARLNEQLGIRNYAALPTLREYLSAHGMTVAQFVSAATKRPVAQNTPPAPGATPAP